MKAEHRKKSGQVILRAASAAGFAISHKVLKLKAFLFSNDQKRNRGSRKMNLLTILVEL